MRSVARPVAWLVVAVLITTALGLVPGALAAPLRAASPGVAPAASNLTGSISGPNVLGQKATGHYTINGTGGPAIASNGTLVGNITFYASVAAGNTTGVTITPGSAAILNGTFPGVLLVVNNVTQAVTISVELASVYQHLNETLNLTYTVEVVAPYTLTATIVNHSSTTVLGFDLAVFLDGVRVGSVAVPTISGGGKYVMTYDYVVLSLSPGWHTFSMSLAQEHGLVTFTNGSTTYSSSFYISGPTTSYTWWYVAGIVAFFAALLILVMGVAARRRGSGKK